MSHKDTLRALVVNKKEYIRHLCDVLAEPIVQDFQAIYEEARERNGGRNGNVLVTFQDALARLPQWNNEQIHETCERVESASGCNYLSELVKAILICYVKVTLLAHGGSDDGKINLRVPSLDHFIHRCYVTIARALWKRPHLLYHHVRTLERQANLNEVEGIVRDCIRVTIRSFVPMGQLVASNLEVPSKVVMNETVKEEEASEASEAAPSKEDEASEEDESEEAVSEEDEGEENETEEAVSEEDEGEASEASEEDEGEEDEGEEDEGEEDEGGEDKAAASEEDRDEDIDAIINQTEPETKVVTVSKVQGAFF